MVNVFPDHVRYAEESPPYPIQNIIAKEAGYFERIGGFQKWVNFEGAPILNRHDFVDTLVLSRTLKCCCQDYEQAEAILGTIGQLIRAFNEDKVR